MKLAHAVQSIGLFTGRISLLKSCLVLVFMATGLMSCAQQNQLRYLYLNNEVEDTEWGFSGSEARMEVTERVAVSAATKLDDETGLLRTEVTITNATGDYMKLLYRGCPVQIQIFEDEEREGDPVFDSFASPEYECNRREVVRTLFGLEDLGITELTHVKKAFPDEIPEGRYYISAVVRPNGIPVTVPAGEIQFLQEGSDS